jgi:hypothetical protein
VSQAAGDALLYEGPDGAIGPLLAIVGEGPAARLRVGTLARLLRIARQTLWRQCTRLGLVGTDGLVCIGDVAAISPAYERRVTDLMDYAHETLRTEAQGLEARLAALEGAVDAIGAVLGLHPWSATPMASPPRRTSYTPR